MSYMKEINIVINKIDENLCLHGAYMSANVVSLILRVYREAAGMLKSTYEMQCQLTLSCCLDVHRLKASIECRRVNNIRLKVDDSSYTQRGPQLQKWPGKLSQLSQCRHTEQHHLNQEQLKGKKAYGIWWLEKILTVHIRIAIIFSDSVTFL